MTTSRHGPRRTASRPARFERVVLLSLALLGAATLFYAKVDAESGDCHPGDGSRATCGAPGAAAPADALEGFVKIDLGRCDDGSVARWHPGSAERVTFKINDWVGVTPEVVRAVRRGVLQWNGAQPFFAVREVTSRDADIVIEVFDQVFPGIVGATKVKCESGREGIRAAAVYLGVKGISPLGVRNMTAHEIGHALGLGHSDKSYDLMDSRLAEKELEVRAICPSNLDRRGLIAGFHSYEMPGKDWVELKCPAQSRG